MGATRRTTYADFDKRFTGEDEIFALTRIESRLAEMMSEEYLRLQHMCFITEGGSSNALPLRTPPYSGHCQTLIPAEALGGTGWAHLTPDSPPSAVEAPTR